ncbi:hypothetical protein CsSME_00028571 [Camellia sinensis var. sinensis]
MQLLESTLVKILFKLVNAARMEGAHGVMVGRAAYNKYAQCAGLLTTDWVSPESDLKYPIGLVEIQSDYPIKSESV